MLTAFNEQNELITLTRNLKRDHLEKLRKKEQFYCPQCQEPLLMKIGQVMIPHFAHLKKSQCQGLFSEGETAAHLLGKHQLYEMFQKLQLNVQIEPYFKEISQRPDLLVESNYQRFAIEFQCSTIPIPQMETRTEGYLRANIQPIWILKTPKDRHPYPDGIQQIKLSPFKQQFITYIQNHLHLITFDPESATFVYFSYLLPIGGGYRFIGKVQHLPLEAQHFPFLNVLVPSESDFQIYWQLWKKERFLFLRRRVLMSRKGVQDSFLRACYFMNYPVEKLPLFIGIPVTKHMHFSVFEVEWQMLWLMFLIEQGENFTHPSSRSINEFCKRYPAICLDQQAVVSLENYHFILRRLGITCINSQFDEKMLWQSIYAQFLAKR
nr:competence protein CoiA family protein [Rummeliibacillus suwonensis]